MKNFDSIAFLSELIGIPSFSGEESHTADLIEKILAGFGTDPQRFNNNVWARSNHFDPNLPSVLLNSHHDTVKPGRGWDRDPFSPDVSEGKLFGLGSNDAGGRTSRRHSFSRLHGI